MSSHQTSVLSWTALGKLFPKSFFYKITQDLGLDGEPFTKGSVFYKTLSESRINYDCKYAHDNSSWFFALEKMDICTPQFAKTYMVIHLIPFLLFKRK